MKIVVRKESLDLFNGAENLSIVHLSDLHLRYSVKKLIIIQDIITELKPDLIVMTGDYFDIPTGAENFRKFLIEMSKDRPIVFISGNHDRVYGAMVFKNLLDIPNCTCVDNSHFQFSSKAGFIYDFSSLQIAHNSALPANTKNIGLIHKPGDIDRKSLKGFDLVLAGHLHGGQFVFYKAKDTSLYPGALFYKNCVERNEINGIPLIVSKGLGDTFPFRFNCPKEIIEIRIK